MKKQNNSSDLVLVAAAAGAAAAGAVIAIYEVLKSEKGQAGIAKAKTGVVNTATKAKESVVSTAAKAKEGVVNTAAKVKAKLPKKAVAEECDCDLGLDDETAEEMTADEVIDEATEG